MKIVTYSNKNTNGYLRYLDSCRKNKIILINLAKKNEKFSLVLKLKYMIDFLKITPPKEIICFTDSWDVIFLDNLENIKKKFISMNIPYLFSAEENFYYADKLDIKKKWPYKKHFLNTGGYIGYNDELLKIFNEIDKHDYYNNTWCDQAVLYNYFYYNPKKLIIDYNREIFGTFYKKTNQISNIFLNLCFYKSNYLIKNKNLFYKNNNKILILHYPGKKKFFLNYMAYINNYYNTLILEIIIEILFFIIYFVITIFFCSNFYFVLIFVVNLYYKEYFTRPIRHYIKYYKRKLIEL